MAAFAIYLALIRNDLGFADEILPARICDACDVALTVTIVPVSSGNHFRLFMRSLPRGVVYFASLGFSFVETSTVCAMMGLVRPERRKPTIVQLVHFARFLLSRGCADAEADFRIASSEI